jgi:hypothetical protein
MYSAKDPIVRLLATNTSEQEEELRVRTLLIGGSRASKLLAHSILHKTTADRQVSNLQGTGVPTLSRPLQAPYGEYQPLSAEQTNIVSVHFSDIGTIEAYGPFASDEEAYDYFPDHSSPHETTVAVFSVPANMT